MNDQIHEHCLICGSTSIRPLSRYHAIHLVKCDNCSFVFSQKIPSFQELAALYNKYSRDDYLSPVTVKRFHEILDRLEKFRQTNNMLDVGCGIGYFLEEAAKRKWNVYGTEFTDEAVRICSAKGIKMQQGKLNPHNYEPNSFDVIISVEVIEHLNNPVEEIKNFRTLLRTGGAVYITTPNFDSLSRKLLKEKWNVLTYPEHLCYYTRTTLTRLFYDCGFRRSAMRTTGVSVSRIKSSMTDSQEPAVSSSSQDEKLRRKLESNFFSRAAKSAVNGMLNFTVTGDNLKGLFIKM